MKSRLFFLSIVLTQFVVTLSAQGSMKVYGGVSALQTRDAIVSPEGTDHSGFHLGIDGTFAGEDMYFILGARYSSLPLMGSEDQSFFEPENKFNQTSIRVGLGYRLFKIGRIASIRAKTLGSFDILNSTSSSPISNPSYQNINDGHGALIGGLGVQVWFMHLDLEYRYGVFNLYNKQKDTVLDGYTLSLGLSF